MLINCYFGWKEKPFWTNKSIFKCSFPSSSFFFLNCKQDLRGSFLSIFWKKKIEIKTHSFLFLFLLNCHSLKTVDLQTNHHHQHHHSVLLLLFWFLFNFERKWEREKVKSCISFVLSSFTKIARDFLLTDSKLLFP